MLRISRLTDYATVILATLAQEPGRVQTRCLPVRPDTATRRPRSASCSSSFSERGS